MFFYADLNTMGSVYFILHFGLQVKLADPDIVSNHTEYQKLAQSMAELEEVSQFVWFGLFIFLCQEFTVESVTPVIYGISVVW